VQLDMATRALLVTLTDAATFPIPAARAAEWYQKLKSVAEELRVAAIAEIT
jgi:hypothetical protein